MKGVNNMEVTTEYFKSLISKLNSSESEWTEAAELIHRILKEEMQSNNAQQDVIKKVRDQFESRRQDSISKATAKFQQSADLNKLDEQSGLFYNSLLLVDNELSILQQYNKQHLHKIQCIIILKGN